MTVEIVVKLSEKDIEHFRAAMREIYSTKSDLDEKTIINHATTEPIAKPTSPYKLCDTESII